MRYRSFTNPEKWMVLGIPILFIVGAIMHFLYNILWENPVVGVIAPINESIWEHSKMVVWPIILWWTIYYRFQGKRHKINADKWFASALVALVTSLVAMPMLYYFYTGAFGVELLWVDILILLLAISFGQMLGLHTYQHGKGIPAKWSLIIFGVIVLLFLLFTFFPPHIPLFQDPVTGGYGLTMNTP